MRRSKGDLVRSEGLIRGADNRLDPVRITPGFKAGRGIFSWGLRITPRFGRKLGRTV